MDDQILTVLNQLVETQKETNKRLDKMDTRLDSLENKVEDNTSKLNNLETTMKDSFEKVDARFDNLTKDIGNLITKEVGDYISNSLSRMESKTDRIDETTNELKADIQVIKVAVAKHEDDSKYFKKHHLRQV